MHRLGFALFLTIAVSIYVGMHYYVLTRVTSGLQLDGALRNLLKIVFLVGAASFFLAEIFSREAPVPLIRPLWYFSMVWLGLISLALSVFVLSDIARIFFRGQAFRHTATLVSLGAIALLAAYSLANEAYVRVSREIHVKTAKLPKHVERFSIVQLSDIHINPFTSPRWLQKIVDRSNAADADIVVVTGDLLDTDVCAYPELCAILKQLKSRYGIYAITGNHEYYAGIPVFMKNARELNITVLRNSRTTVAGAIELVGIDDDISARGAKAGPEIEQVLSDGEPATLKRPVVLLSHRPDTFDAAAKLGVDLQLSGHTHAGQIPPLDLLVYLSFKYPAGLYRKGDSCCYTTTGTGYWGPPMRLTSRSEVVKIVLEK